MNSPLIWIDNRLLQALKSDKQFWPKRNGPVDDTADN